MTTREKDIHEKLERELNLRQLQIRSLLTITQAINENVSAEGLFGMYKNFMNWDMGVQKLALFIRQNDQWQCVSYSNIDLPVLNGAAEKVLLQYKRLHTIKSSDDKALQDFDIIIPVYHKETPIAYALVGGIKEKEDLYNKIQFITSITNIIAVAIENKRLFKRQIEQERFKRDMELATTVQQMLIPETLPKGKNYEFDAVYKPHSNIGGDYFDIIQYTDQRLAFCIADVSGKGVAAALLMANFQAILRSLIFQYRDLETFVFALNESVYRITKSDKFITLFIAELDLRSKVIKYINAGHFPPFLLREGEIIRLRTGSPIIGAVERLPMLEMGEEKLDGEGIILTFTDGLNDLRNAKGEFFSEERIEKFISENYHLSASVFNKQLMKTLDTFKGKKPYPDDIAILTCKYLLK